jgi:hypothetical protein
MQLYLQGSPLVEMTAKKSDGTILFVVETHPYLEDQRTEIYDAEGDVLGSIIWNGTQPSHICVYSESASQAQAFEMVPRGDPTAYVFSLFHSFVVWIMCSPLRPIPPPISHFSLFTFSITLYFRPCDVGRSVHPPIAQSPAVGLTPSIQPIHVAAPLIICPSPFATHPSIRPPPICRFSRVIVVVSRSSQFNC